MVNRFCDFQEQFQEHLLGQDYHQLKNTPFMGAIILDSHKLQTPIF